MIANFSLGRHESMPPIDEDHFETFRRLAPHLRRAALISDLLESRSIVASSFESALDALGSAVLLVDANLRIVHANERAEPMLREGEFVASVDGRLELTREL